MSYRPIIGQNYAGPNFDRPALRRLPSHWVLEETRRAPAWWRFWASIDRVIVFASVVILLYVAGAAFSQARAADKPVFRKAEPINPVWSIKRCKAQGRTYLANLSDARGWKVRCTGRPVRT